MESPPPASPASPTSVQTLRPHRRWPVRTMFLSWFGLGLVGRAPGTLGSAGSLPHAAIIVWVWGQNALLSAASGVFLNRWGLTGADLRGGPAEKGPQWVVIDRVAAPGAVLAVVPLDLGWYLAAFALFRL